MLQTTLEESLTAKELEDKIKKHFGGARSNSPGRPMTKPKNFAGFLESVTTTADIIVKKSNQVWLNEDAGLITSASELDTVNVVILEKIDEAMDKLSDAVIAASDTTKALQDIRKELSTRTGKASKASNKVIDEDDEDEDDDFEDYPDDDLDDVADEDDDLDEDEEDDD